jgi:Ca2+-binding RTX toxin-like protein
MPHGILGRHRRALKFAICVIAAAACAAPAAAQESQLPPTVGPDATVAVPTIEIGSVQVLGPSTARVSATVETNDADTTVYLRYGEGTVLDQRTPGVEVSGSVAPTKVVEDLLDLAPGSSYHVQAVLDTPAGPVATSTVPFTTPAAVFVSPTTGALLRSSATGKRTRCTIVGTAGRDRLVGTKKRDVICSLGGNDRILGRGGNDLILAGKGSDNASGGAGRDRIYGNSGRDRLYGNSGRDRLYGNSGGDRLNAASNRHRGDYVSGGKGRDRATVNRGDRVRSVERVSRR